MGFYDDFLASHGATATKRAANVEWSLKAIDKVDAQIRSDVDTKLNAKADKSDTYTKSEIFKVIYPVGSIYLSVNNVNPSALFSGTTWVAWGSGRVSVGVNTSNTNFNSVEKTGGEEKHTLSRTELPPHQHALQGKNVACDSYNLYEEPNGSVADKSTRYMRNYITVTSTDGGDGNSHNNLQPYITCYMWKRTA